MKEIDNIGRAFFLKKRDIHFIHFPEGVEIFHESILDMAKYITQMYCADPFGFEKDFDFCHCQTELGKVFIDRKFKVREGGRTFKWVKPIAVISLSVNHEEPTIKEVFTDEFPCDKLFGGKCPFED